MTVFFGLRSRDRRPNMMPLKCWFRIHVGLTFWLFIVGMYSRLGYDIRTLSPTVDSVVELEEEHAKFHRGERPPYYADVHELR